MLLWQSPLSLPSTGPMSTTTSTPPRQCKWSQWLGLDMGLGHPIMQLYLDPPPLALLLQENMYMVVFTIIRMPPFHPCTCQPSTSLDFYCCFTCGCCWRGEQRSSDKGGGLFLGPARIVHAEMHAHPCIIFGVMAKRHVHVETGTCSQRAIAAWQGVFDQYFHPVHGTGRAWTMWTDKKTGLMKFRKSVFTALVSCQ